MPILGGWKSGSAVKNTCYFCREPGFSSQHIYGGAQPSLTLVPGDLMSPFGLWVRYRNAKVPWSSRVLQFCGKLMS